MRWFDLTAIQAECLADDLPLEPEMLSWSLTEVTAFFESGGAERPPAPSAAAPAPALPLESGQARPDPGPAHAPEPSPPAAGRPDDPAAPGWPRDPLANRLLDAAPTAAPACESGSRSGTALDCPGVPPEAGREAMVPLDNAERCVSPGLASAAHPEEEERDSECDSNCDMESSSPGSVGAGEPFDGVGEPFGSGMGEPFGSGMEGLRPLQWANCELLQEIVRLVSAPSGIVSSPKRRCQLPHPGPPPYLH